MGTKRSQVDILLDVLRVIELGTTKPTRIMYRANLSGTPLIRLLEKCVDNGLICVERVRRGQRMDRRYSITEKGREVLEAYQDLFAFLREMEIKLQEA